MNHQSPSTNTQEWKTTDLSPERFWTRPGTLLVKGEEKARGRKHPNLDEKIDRTGKTVFNPEPCTASDGVTARTRKGEESAFGRKAWKERHGIKAGIQLCFLTDKNDPGDRGHLLVRGWQSRVTRYQETGPNSLLMLPLWKNHSKLFPVEAPITAVGGRGEKLAARTGSGLLAGISRCLWAGSTARGGGEQRSRSNCELQITKTRWDWDA